MIFSENCHVCGTKGKVWNKNPEVWKCPKCQTVFSKFGVILENEPDSEDFWN